jgi:hypothetical protein
VPVAPAGMIDRELPRESDGGVFAPRRALELAAIVTAVPGAGDRKASGPP